MKKKEKSWKKERKGLREKIDEIKRLKEMIEEEIKEGKRKKEEKLRRRGVPKDGEKEFETKKKMEKRF